MPYLSKNMAFGVSEVPHLSENPTFGVSEGAAFEQKSDFWGVRRCCRTKSSFHFRQEQVLNPTPDSYLVVKEVVVQPFQPFSEVEDCVMFPR